MNVSAQSQFETWTIDNGLPQNTVRSILQTRDGYLWFATFNGLVRFDGVRFTVFDRSNTATLSSNRLISLYEDSTGTLWIGAEDYGMTKYANGIFTKFTLSDVEKWKTQVAAGKEPELPPWVAGQGITYRADLPLATPPSGSDPADEQDFLKMERSRWGIVAGNGGLMVFRNGQPSTYTRKDGLSSSKITAIYRDSRGVVWIGTEDAGLNRFQNGQFVVYGKKHGLPSERLPITAVCEDRRGGIWIAERSGAVYRLKNGVLNTYISAEEKPKSRIASLFEDQEGSIWIGTTDAGINRWREKTVAVLSSRDGLFSDNTYPILEDRSGSVWIATWPGLNLYRDGKFIQLPNTDKEPYGAVTSLYEDSEGALWIGTYGNGVRKYKDGRYLLKSVPGLTEKEANGVLAITQDGSGTVWFGTTSGLFSYQGGALKHLTTADGLPHRQINAILTNRDGELWLGTLGGLARLKDGKFRIYTEREGLSANHIRSLYQDANGVLWVGTYDGGLNRFKDGHFTRYTMNEGMFDNGVFQILEDAHANFWMSSNRGIYRVRREELENFAAGKVRSVTSVAYGRSDGLRNAECNGGVQPAGVKTRDGRLWLPTQQGVAIIDPETVNANLHSPAVLIEEFSLDDRKIPFAAGVRVLPGQERFEIKYTAPSFIKPEQVRFKYKLEGLDSDWVDAETRRATNYSHVPPGKYTFRVIAANSDGVWNREGASLSITVQPPFWRTWWFIALASLAAIGGTVLWFRQRLRRAEQAQAAQQKFSRQLIASQEHERKRIAAELHDSLGQSLAIIRSRAMLSLSTPADHERAIEQMDEIAEAANNAISEVKEISYNLRPFQLDRFGLTRAIESMLKRAADSYPIQFTVNLDNIDGILSKESEINLYRIVQESINNIIKHSEASAARIRIERAERQAELTIQDNGKGFLQDANNGEGAKSKFGLIGLAERAGMLGAKIEIRSVLGEGTVIKLNIDLTEKKDGR